MLDAACAERLLTHKGVLAALARFRLPRYSEIAEQMQEYRIVRDIKALWRELWPGRPLPSGGSYDMDSELIAAIAEEFFPWDDDVIDAYMQSDDYMMTWGPEPLTFGIPWERDAMDVGRHILPLFCCAYSGLTPANGWEDALIDVDEKVALWFDGQGYAPPDNDLVQRYNVIAMRLRDLPDPLSGLEVAYRCLLRQTGNPFFDHVPSAYHGDYDLWGTWDWDVGVIRQLGRDWQEAQPQIERLDRYIEWWQLQRDPESVVMAAMATVFELEMLEAEDDSDD